MATNAGDVPPKRVFILGAGFSKPAGLPIATEILPLLIEELKLDEMSDWLDSLNQRLQWLSGNESISTSLSLNIEQVFHFAQFDAELWRLKQHCCQVGRNDGPGTPWNVAEGISAWLSYLEDSLRDVLVAKQDKADLSKISRWAKHVTDSDSIVTFNYDTLVELAIGLLDRKWTHGLAVDRNCGIPIFKMHGSIDWIVAHRTEPFPTFDLIFDKVNHNRGEHTTEHIEDDGRLWRCRDWDQLKRWISGREVQMIPEGAFPHFVGIAGLGSYKPLHAIPGLGQVWDNALRSLYEAETAVIVGFAMSDFDAMAQLHFGEVACARDRDCRPLRVIVIDPYSNDEHKARFKRVFRNVEFV